MKERTFLIIGLVLLSSTKTKEAKSAFPRYDGDELWTTMGHLYKGGMWFKKKVYISGFYLLQVCRPLKVDTSSDTTRLLATKCVFRRCAHRIYVLADAYLLTARYALRSC